MAQYKYHIGMNYMNGDTNIEIKPENIKHLYIENDYGSTHMPMIYATLHIDKNIYDQIITNAKTAVINMNIYKILFDDKTETKILTQYKGECSYFVSGDINYNKEIDYATSGSDKTVRKDIYKEVSIGFMYKDCIEYNKQTNNTTIKDTTMINAVASYLQGIPLLIENFTYNDTISQLVVPPQNSLAKTINFFNSIKVFYDTPYRFFIDPGCVYLISSSGKAIPKRGEKYNTIIFNIHSITDDEANVLGMEEDDKNKCYRVDVNVLDTHYTIDNDTCKTVNSISSIINPSKENSLASLGSIQNVTAKINKIISSINNSISGQTGSIVKMPSSVSNIKAQVRGSTDNIKAATTSSVALIEEAITIIQSLPEEQTVTDNGDGTTTTSDMQIITAAEKVVVIGKLNTDKQTLQTQTDDFAATSLELQDSIDSLIGNLGMTTSRIPGLVNSITAVNISDNISSLKKLYGGIKGQSATNKNFAINTLLPKINTGRSIATTTQLIISELSALGFTELDDTVEALVVNKTTTETEVDVVATNLNKYANHTTDVNDMHGIIEPFISKFDGIEINLKQQFINQTIDIQSISSAGGNIASIINSATSNINSLKTKGLSLSTIKDISTNINNIKDISQIGKVGVSKFNVDLNFDGSSGSSGERIIRINNDNANQIKNIKATMENKANKLTLNKNDLDTSVFTMNKEYVVKNYDAHSNKDGKFLLNRKVEIYMRQDDKFILNTMLEFDKLADDNTGSVAARELGKSTVEVTDTRDTRSIIDNASSIINTIKANSNTPLTKQASIISKVYRKMTDSKPGNISTTLTDVIE